MNEDEREAMTAQGVVTIAWIEIPYLRMWKRAVHALASKPWRKTTRSRHNDFLSTQQTIPIPFRRLEHIHKGREIAMQGHSLLPNMTSFNLLTQNHISRLSGIAASALSRTAVSNRGND